MRKTEKCNIFFQLFGAAFIGKGGERKDLTLLGKKRMIKTHNRMHIQPKI